MIPVDTLAIALHDARRNGTRVPPGESPPSIEEAYAVQAALFPLTDSPLVGFKLGATLDAALATLALDESFHAPLHARHQYADGDEVPVFDAHVSTVETEFVVTLSADVAAGADEDAVRAATASVRPGFEIVATRFDMTLPGNGTRLVADAGGHSATVLGEAVSEKVWRELDLSAHPATLSIDGTPRAEGHSGQSIGGDPFAMIAWLLSRPAFAARGLRAGELVYCGSCTGMLPVVAGNALEGDFGELGRVRTTLRRADP